MPAVPSIPMPADLTELTALELSAAVQARRLSCRDMMTAYLDRIERLNPGCNAIVSLQPRDVLLAEADVCDAELAAGRSRGWMHGFPMAIKDVVATAGIRTTFGSPLADHVPAADALLVTRMKQAGGIVIGKTNTPEFGLGSHTYNALFGTTRNAVDPSRTAGGSSGGAAVSVALRLQPVADGSDFMGSLRNPAAFNGIFGFRPSPGRVPVNPAGDQYVNLLSTDGPMARNVDDLAMLLSVQAGPDPRVPSSLSDPGAAFAPPLAPLPPRPRIGWLGDLAGHLAIEDGILAACESGLTRLQAIGCIVEPASIGLPLDEVWQTWLTWRRWLVAGRLRAFIRTPRDRDRLKPEAQWELEQGERLGAAAVHDASVERSVYFRHMLKLFERHDFLVLPSAQVWPFAAEVDWPRRIGSRTMDTYHRWMEVTLYASLAGLPALSVPVASSADGLPMGMQIIGPPRADLAVLRLGRAYQQTAG